MKIAIADDISSIVTEVQEITRTFFEEHGVPVEISTFSRPGDFIKSLETDQYGLVIMDVYFDGEDLTGVDAIRKLREVDRRCMVVFLTDSSDHMPDAFSVHAFSYIMKHDLGSMLPKTLDDLMGAIQVTRSITVTHNKQQLMLHLADIVSIRTEGHYLIIRDITKEEYRVRMTFSDISKKLEKAKEFLLINKGILVNMDHVRNFDGNSAVMTDGSSLPVRVRGQSGIVRQWHDYNFDKLRAENI